MSAFSDVEMPVGKALAAQSENCVQQRIENAAGVVGGEQGARLNGDDNQPENRSDPGFKNLVAVGVQP